MRVVSEYKKYYIGDEWHPRLCVNLQEAHNKFVESKNWENIKWTRSEYTLGKLSKGYYWANSGYRIMLWNGEKAEYLGWYKTAKEAKKRVKEIRNGKA